MDTADINYTKEAFLNPWNLAFLLVALLVTFGASLASGSPAWLFETMLLFTAAAELLFLGVVPRNERFRRLVRSQKIEEHRKPPSQKEIFRTLSRTSQRRYARLRKLEKDIEANYRKLSYASQGLLDSHLSKLDGLLDSYLSLMLQKERAENNAQGQTDQEIERAIAELKDDMADDADRVKSIKERRLRILEQRLARFRKGRENLDVIQAQLETIEDTVKYIHEQSWTLQNPDEITFQLDTLLDEVEETQSSVQEIEDVFGKSTNDLLSGLDTYGSEEEDAPREGRRLRE